MDGNSFVVYRSYYNTYLLLKKKNPEDAQAFIDAILRYGFTGETPEIGADIWVYGLDTIFAQIDASTSNYEKSKNSGGGRPGANISEEEIYEQMALFNTWKDVAAALGIDEDTLRKLRNQYNILEKSPKNYRKTEKLSPKNRKTEKPTEKPSGRKTDRPKNLNDNVNQNSNLNKNKIKEPAQKEKLVEESTVEENETLKNTIVEETEKTEKLDSCIFRYKQDLSVDEIITMIVSEDEEIVVEEGKITNYTTGEIIELTEESWRNYQASIEW